MRLREEEEDSGSNISIDSEGELPPNSKLMQVEN